jgi:methionyl-tRNA formyltransferase
MRLCILTTETLHHAQYVRALADRGHDLVALVEQGALKPPYDTAHPFEAEREAYEREHWFGGKAARIADFCPARSFDDINQPDCVAAVANSGAALVVTFGTRLLRRDIIAAGGARLLNLHGGDPEQYRGLDTHLWAIWHGDFSGLQTCLHRVDGDLDTGEILACLPVELSRGIPLHQLRRANTETCLRLTELAIEQMAAQGRLDTRPQRQKGRYYSFMPTALKAVCVNRFARHTERL